MSVLVEGGMIREVSDKPIAARDAAVFDVRGRTLMPGLIDAHMHAYASDVNMFKVEAAGTPYRTAHAVRMLGYTLDCGFTTVPDIGGGGTPLPNPPAERAAGAARRATRGRGRAR